MVLRRELESWAPTGSFSLDGSSSDLALQFYLRSQAGDEVSRLSLASVPDTVSSRLSAVDVAFDDLDGFAQRAVLWDSGFALTPENELKQIWTLNGLSMAEIALTLDEYEATTCTAFECTQPDGTYTYNNNNCTGTTMLTGVKCVVEEFEQTNLDLAMWSIGGDLTSIPEIYLAKHSWTYRGEDYKVYAVHTLDPTTERKYGGCPTTETYGYLNIPCYGSDDDISGELTEPTPSDWITSWAQPFAVNSDPASSSTGGSGSRYSKSTSASSPNSQTSDTSASASNGDYHRSTNSAVLGGAVGGGLGLLLIVVIVALIVAARKRRNSSESKDPGTPKVVEHVELVSPDVKHWDEHRPRSTLDESVPRTGVTAPVSDDSWSNGVWIEVFPPSIKGSTDRLLLSLNLHTTLQIVLCSTLQDKQPVLHTTNRVSGYLSQKLLHQRMKKLFGSVTGTPKPER